MRNLSNMGRICYGIAIGAMGLQMCCYQDFPYMLLPPNYSQFPSITIIDVICGILFVLAGACIVLGKKTRQVSLLLGVVLLLIFCFYYIPYQLLTKSSYTHFGEWENAAKELALAAGALVVANCFAQKNEDSFPGLLGKLMPFGAIIFAITIISFSIDHFLYAKEAADYIPSWIPNHLFWMYFAGAALLGSGLAIILKIRTGLFAALLGGMILTWFICLHIPRVMAASSADMPGEITSALIALAYSGTAFVIAGSRNLKILRLL